MNNLINTTENSHSYTDDAATKARAEMTWILSELRIIANRADWLVQEVGRFNKRLYILEASEALRPLTNKKD